MARGKNFFTALLLGTAVSASMTVGAAEAASAQAATGNFQIARQPLATALMQLSRQANVDIVAPAKITRGRMSNAVSADSVDAVLTKMLVGTGLTYTLVGKRYLIQSANAPDSLKADGKQSSSNSNSGSVGGREPSRSGSGVLNGAVTDDLTGVALKGALVQIVETNETTRTDNEGKFRLVRVPEGALTLRITYLGYADVADTIRVRAGEQLEANYKMRPGGGADIVVYGSLSARAQALNLERAAENSSTVVSSDLLGDFGGQSISETLRRASGVSFDRDPLTGEGTNISIRGLAPDLNAVKLNGIELPVGDGFGRSASLANIQTESIDRITISKTLLPNQDSAGSGGLIEIETKSPLDRNRRFATFTVEGGKRANGFNDEFSASGTISARFGENDNFGISVSAQYQDKSTRRIQSSLGGYQFGQYIPLQVDGTPNYGRDFVDPRLPFPFEDGAGGIYASTANNSSDSTNGRNFTVTVSTAWKPDESTTLRLDYQTARLKQSQFQRVNTLYGTVGYDLRPIAALNGEERYAIGWQGDIQSSTRYQYVPQNDAKTDVLTFRGKSQLGQIDANYSLGYTIGSLKTRNYTLAASASYIANADSSYIDEGLITDPVEGRIFSPILPISENGPALPALTDAGFAFFNDPSSYGLTELSDTFTSGRNSRITGEFSLKYNLNRGPLRYIEVGGQYEESKFSHSPTDRTSYYVPNKINLADLGLEYDDAILRPIGYDANFTVISYDDIREFATKTAPSMAVPSSNDPNQPPAPLYVSKLAVNPLEAQQFTHETEFAGYVQARLDIDKLEIIGGARFSNILIKSANLNTPTIYRVDFSNDIEFQRNNIKLTNASVNQFNILPRLLMNYRASESLIFRGGYFLSIARPQIQLLSSAIRPTLFLPPRFGPNFNKPQLLMASGNPDLKPAYTHSFDFGAEYYDHNVGVLKINVFYKRIKNLLEINSPRILNTVEGIELPDDPRFDDVVSNPGAYFISLTIPKNNPKIATIWGFETSFERQLEFLPGPLGGIGLFANYTYSRSSKTQPFDWQFHPVLDDDGNVVNYDVESINFPNVPFSGSPKHSGTFGVSYRKYNIDARVSCTMQSGRLADFQPNELNGEDSAFGTLDARVQYDLPTGILGNAHMYIEGYDLLRGPSDSGQYFSNQGIRTSNSFYGGRQIRVGLSTSF